MFDDLVAAIEASVGRPLTVQMEMILPKSERMRWSNRPIFHDINRDISPKIVQNGGYLGDSICSQGADPYTQPQICYAVIRC